MVVGLAIRPLVNQHRFKSSSMDSSEMKQKNFPERSHLKQGLTREVAHIICMNQCKGQCCRGPLILRLEQTEVAGFKTLGRSLGIETHVSPSLDGGAWVKFTEHTGEHCPMLDPNTSECRIYSNRPRRCRSFPEKPTPGCMISSD